VLACNPETMLSSRKQTVGAMAYAAKSPGRCATAEFSVRTHAAVMTYSPGTQQVVMAFNKQQHRIRYDQCVSTQRIAAPHAHDANQPSPPH